MNFTMVHQNLNVINLDKSLAFYKQALGLSEKRRKVSEDDSYIIVFLGNQNSDFELELTWLKAQQKPYDLGDNEFHLAFRTDNFEEAHALHEQMGCICYENPKMGIYFINDPDGYWLEIIPTRKPQA